MGSGFELASLALVSGALATFNPCGAGMLFAYVGLALGKDQTGGVAHGVRVGLLMTLGLELLYVLLAAVFGAVAGWLGSRLPQIGIGLAVVFIAWGAGLMVAPERFTPHITPLAAARARPAAGPFFFGVAFGLGSLGCTFPLFLSLVMQAWHSGGALKGAAVPVLYALGTGIVMTGLAVAAGLAREQIERVAYGVARFFPRLSGVLIMISGLWVLAYWLVP